MAVEQDWAAYADQAGVSLTDSLLVRTAAGAGVEVLAQDFFARRDNGVIYTAVTAGDTTAEIRSTGTIQSARVRLIARQSSIDDEWNIVAAGSGLVSGGALRFVRGVWTNTPAMTLTPGGELLINATTPAGRLTMASNGQNSAYIDCQGVASGIVINKNNTAGGFNFFTFNGTGVGSITTNGTATAYNTSSDYRLKEDPRPVENALARLLAVPVWNFAWRATGARTDGFYAHELAEVVPCAVTGDKDEMQLVDVVVEPERVTEVLDAHGAPVVIPAVIEQREVPKYQGIDQAKLVPLLVAAVQELAARVAELEAAR